MANYRDIIIEQACWQAKYVRHTAVNLGLCRQKGGGTGGERRTQRSSNVAATFITRVT
jgi:hypothetical protein